MYKFDAGLVYVLFVLISTLAFLLQYSAITKTRCLEIVTEHLLIP